MASVTLSGWPSGATVSVYVRSTIPDHSKTGPSPSGSVVTSGTAASDGTVSLTVANDINYVASDGTRTVNFRVPSSTASSGIPNAPSYSSLASGTSVKAGDLVENGGTVYRRNADGTISGSFNAANWTAVATSSVAKDSLADGLGLWIPRIKPKPRVKGTLIDDCQDATKWNGVAAADTSVIYQGLQSIKLTTNGLGTQVQSVRTFSPAKDMSAGYALIVLRTDAHRDPAKCPAATSTIQISSDNFSTTGAQITSFAAAGTDTLRLNQANRWAPHPIPPMNADPQPASVAGMGLWGLMPGKAQPNWAAITQIKVLLKDQAPPDGSAGITPFSVWVGVIEQVPAPSKPVITFQFDRMNGDALRAARVLAKYGFRGTISCRPDLYGNPGTGGDPAYLTQAELRSLCHDYGWDAALYDVRSTVQGANNFGGGDDSSSTTAGVPYNIRPNASGATGDPVGGKAQLIKDMLTGLHDLRLACGQRAVEAMYGQARKLRDDGWTDVLVPNFAWSNMPTSGIWPNFWPLPDPWRFPKYMWVYSTHWNGGVAGEYEDTLTRVAHNKGLLGCLFHDVRAAGAAVSGFDIDTTRLDSICQLAVSLGYTGALDSEVIRGDV